MSGKPPAGDRGGVMTNSGFVKPNVPPVNQQNKRRKNDVDKMGTISETSRKLILHLLCRFECLLHKEM